MGMSLCLYQQRISQTSVTRLGIATMILKSDIQEKLSAIAKGTLSPWDFHVWLEDSSWNMHQGSSAGAIELAGDIKIIFEEYYQGQISEQQLINSLVSL